jgi:hypothetical protein
MTPAIKVIVYAGLQRQNQSAVASGAYETHVCCGLCDLARKLRFDLWADVKEPPAETFPDFSLVQGQKDQDGFPISGAKLCLAGGKDRGYQMPSHTSDGSARVIYEFGLEPHSKILPLTSGGSWAFFSATFSAGGSGTLTRLAILEYQSGEGKSGALVNLLPYAGSQM